MTITGMSATTGKMLDPVDHIGQSVADIMGTPIGTRPMLRDYGSLHFSLADLPDNAATRLLRASACAMALARWEPRIQLQSVKFLTSDSAQGQSTLRVTYALNSAIAAQSTLQKALIPLS